MALMIVLILVLMGYTNIFVGFQMNVNLMFSFVSFLILPEQSGTSSEVTLTLHPQLIE